MSDETIDIIEEGKRLIHDEHRCPACEIAGPKQVLVANRPLRFHYHDDGTRHYLFCPECGQGYRIDEDRLLILPPCNGGLHPADIGKARMLDLLAATEDSE